MATISYRCDTCKRAIELVENPQGFTVVGKCVITEGCIGRLYRTERNPNNVRQSAPNYVEGLDNYIPRRALYEFTQALALDKWKVAHNMGILPSTFVYLQQDDGKYVLTDNSTYTVKPVDKNTIMVTFPKKVKGIIQCIAKSTVPLVPPTEIAESVQFQVSANNTITFAIPKYLTQIRGQIPTVSEPAITSTITPSPTPTQTPIGMPLNLCTENSVIQLEIEVTKPNEDPFVCFEDISNFTDNRSPWNGWGEVLVGKRRNYCIRSVNLLQLNVFGNSNLKASDIPDGTRVRFLRIDYGTGRKEAIPSRGLLMLLAKSPYAYADKIKDRLVDVGELIGDTPDYFVYRGGELFLNETKVERSYPDISRVIYQAAPPQPSPTPTPTFTPTMTPTISVTPSMSPTPSTSVTPTPTYTATVTPTVTATVSPTVTFTPTATLTPSVTMTVTPTVTPTSDVTPTVTPSVTATITPTPTISVTPSTTELIASPTPTITATITPTVTGSFTPTPTPTLTPHDCAFDASSLSGWTSDGVTMAANPLNPSEQVFRTLPGSYAYINCEQPFDISTEVSVDVYMVNTSSVADLLLGCAPNGHGIMARVDSRNYVTEAHPRYYCGFLQNYTWTSWDMSSDPTNGYEYAMEPGVWHNVKVTVNSLSDEGIVLDMFVDDVFVARSIPLQQFGNYVGINGDSNSGSVAYFRNFSIKRDLFITPTPTPTVTPTISVTPTITRTVTVTPTVTPSITVSATLTPTPSVTPSQGSAAYAHRYWGINVTSNNGGTYASVTELQFFGTDTSTNMVNHANAFTNAFSTSDANPSNIAGYAFDNNVGTKWTSAKLPTYPQRLWWDFGTPQVIYNIGVIGQFNAGGQADLAPNTFDIQYSDDGVNWVSVRTITGETNWLPAEQRIFSVDSPTPTPTPTPTQTPN